MGRTLMFMITVFVLFGIAGAILVGSTGFAATPLVTAIDADDATIVVSSTEGFPDYGIITIGDEHIAYSSANGTVFAGSGFLGETSPLIRGTEGTEATSHVVGETVRTKSNSMLNVGTDYFVAVLADASGLQAFIAKPTAFFQLLGSFMFLPVGVLTGDLQIFTYLYAVVGIGMLVALFASLAGGRRV